MKFIDAIFSGSIFISGSFTPPKGTKDQRPTNPVTASVFFETSDSGSRLLIYHGSGSEGWQEVGLQSDPVPPPPPVASADIEYLVVAGGGGGGYTLEGGGGAGGLLSSSLASVESGSSFNVIVGAGGSGQSTSTQTPNNGTSSSLAGDSISTITALGGGGGGVPAGDGGSGGGARSTEGNEGSGTVGQGFDGGFANGGFGGAGGGASAAGADSTAADRAGGSYSPSGADGKQSNITGTLTYYAGGGGVGGGNAYGTVYPAGTGGQGGGGNGSYGSNAGSAGTANTGGGGGSNGYDWNAVNHNGYAGGSGVVILAYDSGSINGAGGIVGDAGNGRKYHQFNSSGTFKASSTTDFSIVTDSLGVHLDAGNFSSRGTSTWTDLQGNYNITNNGATLGNNFYYSFDGSNDTMTIGAGAHSTYINPSQDYSSEAWIKLTGATTDYVCLMFANSTFDIVANVVRNNAGTVGAFSYHKYETNATYEPTFSDDAGWHHYVFSYASSGTMTIYRDGSELGNGTLDSRSAISSPTMSIGGTYTYNGTRYYRTGNLAHLRYYSKALSAAEVIQNYNATKTNFV